MFEDDHVIIKIVSHKFGEFNCKIDIDDYVMCKDINWHIKRCRWKTKNCEGEKFYVSGKIDNKPTLMHRFLTNATNSLEVDHINHDTIDNRRKNLRICTKGQNSMNKDKPINNKSGRKGVMWYHYNNVNKWLAYMKLNQKFINLGYYDTYEEACSVREKAEESNFREFKYKNN